MLVRGPRLPEGRKAMLIQPRPPRGSRAGALYSVERGLHLCTLAGLVGDHPPDTREGFLAFASSLADPALFEAIRDAPFLGPIRRFRKDQRVFHCYHRLRRWPRGFVVLGDAVACFNPIYGQGMTSAVLQALALEEGLARGLGAGGLQRRVARAASVPWAIARSEDLRWPGAGRRDVIARAMQAFHDVLTRAAARDPAACERYLQSLHMTTPLRSALHPRAWLAGLRPGR